MKLNELKKIIREEIERVLAEAPQPQPQIAEPETDTDVETKPSTPTRRRTITPAKPKTAPAKAATEEIVKKIADRFKKGKK